MFDTWEIPDELLDDPGYWRRRAAIAVREAARTRDLRGWLMLQAQVLDFEHAAAQAAARLRLRRRVMADREEAESLRSLNPLDNKASVSLSRSHVIGKTAGLPRSRLR